MGTLATVSQYVKGADFKDVTQAVTANIQMALQYSTAAIEQLCQHNLESQAYNYWYRSDLNYSDFFTNIEGYNTDFYVMGNRPQYNESYGPNVVVLNQYPITKIAVFKGAPVGNLTCSNVAANLTISNVDMTLDAYDNAGNQTENVITFADNKTLGAIQSNVNSLVGWNFDLFTPYQTTPSVFLRQCYASVNVTNQEITAGVTAAPYKFVIENERKLVFNDVADEILINYTAGYVYPVDNSGNTAVITVGTVPAALQQVCILVANDILAFMFPDSLTGINPRLLKSEHLGDYSYDKFPNMNFDSLVTKYIPLLQNFILKAL